MRDPVSTTTRRVLLLSGLLIGAALSAIYLRHPSFVAFANYRSTDAVMALAPARPPSGAVVIVDIDERALAAYGQWPWPRSLLARLAQRVAASGAATVGLDVVLAEPDRSTPGDGHFTATASDNDRTLADILAQGPFVLGYVFQFRNLTQPPHPCHLHEPGIIAIDMADPTTDRSFFFTAQGVTCDLPLFNDAVSRSGFLNASPDADGILRRMPTLIRFGDSLYPSLPLAALLEYTRSDQVKIVSREAQGRFDLIVGNRSIPVDAQGNLLIRFSPSPEAIRRVSAAEILTGTAAPEQFTGKIVLVGVSAAGLEPSYLTAGGELHTPTEFHGQVLENLLGGQPMVRTNGFAVYEVLTGLAVALAVVLAIASLSMVSSAALCAGLLASTWVAALVIFHRTGYLLSPLLPTVLVLVNYAVLTIVKMWQALAEKQLQLEMMNRNLEQRVNEAVADLRRKDQMMIQQGRQAAMGEMISNIAHQWRQPLNMLGLIVQELRITYGTPAFGKDKLDGSVSDAMKVINHMSQTIDDFRNYFKPDKVKVTFMASEAVARTLSLVGPGLKTAGIEVKVSQIKDGRIYGYPNEYSQVLFNILLNCRDAFEANAVKEKRVICIEIDNEKQRSVVTITDNAGGIPEEVIDKVFDPYFTTKGPDKGTGIGLYMAQTIIEKNMGGKLSVCNTGEGAHFRIVV